MSRESILKLNEQVVLVTGAARGLGHAITQAVAREGARVVINYHRSQDAAQALADTIGQRAFAVQADVTDPAQVQQMFIAAKAHFGAPVTSVINNALVDFKFNGDARKTIHDIGWADFEQQIQGAIAGALNTVQVAVPDMKSMGFGRIVNVGTNLFQNPVVPYHDYTAAKAALLALTRTASQDLGPDGITVNMLSGGLLRTTDASAATPDFVFDLIASQTPLRTVTTPEEFADAVLFFLSPWSRAITGQNLIVDGGLVKN
jgi:3-oxoacyl-[acyl-carrier protein] reductase